MGDAFGEICGSVCGGLCGAVGLAVIGTLQAWCTATPCGLTVCKCCDRLCLCGCCWKGDRGALPEEDYPGGANHPATLAAAAAAAREEAEAEVGTEVPPPPPPYQKAQEGEQGADGGGAGATTRTRTEQPRPQDAMSITKDVSTPGQ